jgi:hypothetical protein
MSMTYKLGLAILSGAAFAFAVTRASQFCLKLLLEPFFEIGQTEAAANGGLFH